MALWYFGALLFTIFSGLYFVYSVDRFAPTDNLRNNLGGMFITCHQAAVAAAKSDTTLGAAAAVSKTCDPTSLSTSRATNIRVSDVRIVISPASTVIPGADGRIITTYLPAGQTLGNVRFNEVVSQVQTNYGAGIDTGLTVAGGPSGVRITPYTATVVPVQASVGIGSLAMSTTVTSKCPSGVSLSPINGKCLKVNATPLTRDAASIACHASGDGHLAQIKNATDASAIVSAGGNNSWVDGTRSGSNWLYEDGTTMTYSGWDTGEPNNYGGTENCIHIYTNAKLNDNTCTNAFSYVCEY